MRAAAVTRVCPEGSGVELKVVGRVVAVDVGIFKDVGLGAEYLQVTNGVSDDLGMAVAELLFEAGPVCGSVERSNCEGDSHCEEGIRRGVCGGVGCVRELNARRTSDPPARL